MASITSANSVFFLGVSSFYPIPQLLQGYSADDAFDTDSIEPAEVKMGVDGRMSAGFVFVPVKINISLQADSVSVVLFDAWYAAQKAQSDVYFAFGIVRFPSIQRSYTLTNGILTGYKPIPDAKKTLEPLKYAITFESIVGAPF